MGPDRQIPVIALTTEQLADLQNEEMPDRPAILHAATELGAGASTNRPPDPHLRPETTGA
ncbi:hypothetical protein RRF57_010673 [Xylaria bambusicola]|uniref:Uncharacterized protein n=1 Tax=Xylaria bambusicola TaxID=326684 RepID=A0AAN7UYH2_9PEZI